MTTEQHVPVEQLAAYAAGDLDAAAALEVETHVLLCADCRSDVEAVQRTTSALAALPPVPMPAEVAARIDAALEQADRPTGPVGDVLPMLPAKKKRVPSFAGMAAVAAGLALVAAITVPFATRGGGGADQGAGGTVAMESSARETKRLESGLNYTHAELSGTLRQALAGRAETAGVTMDDTLKSAPPAAAPSGIEARDGVALALQADPGRLASCIAALAAAQETPEGKVPLVVDFASFDGKPALVVVFPTETRGQVRRDRIDVWVVGPRCGITAGDDDVLDFGRFVRPTGL